MKSFGIILFSLFLLNNINASTLKVGDKVPDFSLKDQNGKLFHLKDHIGKNVLVIYFYPKDDTPGCTKQACYFRDQYEEFIKWGAEVIGISGQDVKSHEAFAKKYNLPFTLLADEGDRVRKMFGAGAGLIPGRVTYIIDKQGKIVYIFNSQTDVTRHVDEALKKIKEIK